MPTLCFFLMDADTAAAFRAATVDNQVRIEPKEIEAGRRAGAYAVNATAASDPLLWEQRVALQALEAVDLDVDEAWPQPTI